MAAIHVSPETTRVAAFENAATDQRRWLALTVIATAQLMIALDATVVNIALPSAQAALAFSDTDRQWVITAYTLCLGGLLFVGGRIADSVTVGRRGALLIGLAGFAGASALSGAAPSFGILVGARALQGAFAALLAPTALSTLAVMFREPRDRARAFGIYGAIAASGGALGLLLGGVLTQYLDWRWCLYVNVPIALLTAAGARAVLPDTRPAAAHGTSNVFRLLPSIVLDRVRGAAYLCALLAVAGMFGAFLFLTYELQVVLRFTPFQAGLAFVPMTASSFVAGTVIAPRLLPRVSPRLLMAPGFVLAAGGMGVLAQLHADSAYWSGILPAEILLGLGIASVMMPASNLATSGVEPRAAGIASAALNSAQQLGASLGTAILNTLAAAATAVYVASTTSAVRTEALVHGYATAALWAALILLIGAVVALFIPHDSVSRRLEYQ